MNDSIDTRLVDEAVDAYVDWREECLVVWDACPYCRRPARVRGLHGRTGD